MNSSIYSVWDTLVGEWCREHSVRRTMRYSLQNNKICIDLEDYRTGSRDLKALAIPHSTAVLLGTPPPDVYEVGKLLRFVTKDVKYMFDTFQEMSLQ